MNAILYARVSTDKQADKELSIPAQLQAMRDYARQHNWTVVEEFIEPGVSARTAERPALQRLLSKVREAHGNVEVVLVHKIDRLARNVYDHATIKALLLQHRIRLASVVENVDESVSGQLVENIMASIAQFYSANLADEVRKGMQQKVLKGGWPHRPPRGYVQVRGDGGESRVEIHPEEGPAIQRAFERYATGWYSLKALATGLAQEGVRNQKGRPIADAYLHELLGNPFYIGRVRWKSLNVPGAHKPLVSVELFDRVQETLRRRFKTPGVRGSVNGFPLRGLAICAYCRGHMTAGYQRRLWGYYRCARRGYNKSLCSASKYSPSKLAHRAVEHLCLRLRLPSSTLEAILEAARRIVEERTADSQRRIGELKDERSTLSGQEMRLTQGFISGDVLSDAYREASAQLKSKVRTIESELAMLRHTPAELLAKVKTMLQRATSVWALSEQLSDNRQVELLRLVFQKIVLDETGLVGFTLRPPFDAIFAGRAGDSADNASHDPNPIDTSDVATRIVQSAIDSPDAVIEPAWAA